MRPPHRAGPARTAPGASAPGQTVTFIQRDEPALQDGEYMITVEQVTNQATETFTARRRFAVAGERFALDPSELAALFPPDLAVGELSGALPHVLINRRTLPWERRLAPDNADAPWLAVLLFDDGQQPTPVPRSATDLIPPGAAITVAGSAVPGTGTLPANVVSYPRIWELGYGETPDDACTTIDIDAALFSAVAPAAADLPFLAHVRETDAAGTAGTPQVTSSTTVVLGNRVPQDGQTAHAYLVSLEGLAPLLPSTDGIPADTLAGFNQVRLIAYRWWSFTATGGAATFQGLIEGVNPAGSAAATTLQLPYAGPRPDAAQVAQAMGHQAAGSLTDADAAVLARNAIALGYLPFGHRLRHGGQTVSWYRGPLAPIPVTATVPTPLSCADAATRYNPQDGMLDVSYAAAWQLGLLLGLQSRSFAVALCNWRHALAVSAVANAEQVRYEALLGGTFTSLLGVRAARLASAESAPPDAVVEWLARLATLDGVPFNYLVPDERMLPPESLRMFHLDGAWVDALLDGAFSIGRATAADLTLDASRAPAVRMLVNARCRPRPGSPAPSLVTDPGQDNAGEITGFLLRSAAVAGWPDATVAGYPNTTRTQELKLLRSARLGTDVLLCLFDGVARMVTVREHPGQLHCGVEEESGGFTTTLRDMTGRQLGSSAPVYTRADGLPGRTTLQVAATATAIKAMLASVAPPGPADFTAAEFALEMVKGVVEVEFEFEFSQA